MLSAGVESYYDFASNVSLLIGDKPISFEVLEEIMIKFLNKRKNYINYQKMFLLKFLLLGAQD